MIVATTGLGGRLIFRSFLAFWALWLFYWVGYVNYRWAESLAN